MIHDLLDERVCVYLEVGYPIISPHKNDSHRVFGIVFFFFFCIMGYLGDTDEIKKNRYYNAYTWKRGNRAFN